ncbi:hypothetical protein ACIBJC_10270 [Streptomyces sp. NPDC050509]|uniref:hypothetical protein n=1 Tax=Streptomyces sp. NPDC050509 TaxID=3365620 RepID=UPI00379A1E57
MPEEYVTKSDLEVRLAQKDVANATEVYVTPSEASEAIKDAIEGYDKEKKNEEEEFKWFSDWKHWNAIELNTIKSEFTALKAEFVPLNASLPSFFSLEELIKNRLNLEYDERGLLQRRARSNADDPPATGGTGEPAARATPPPASPAPPTNDPPPPGRAQRGTTTTPSPAPAPAQGRSEPTTRSSNTRTAGTRTPGPTTAQLRQQGDQARRTREAMHRVAAAARPAADGVRRVTDEVNRLDRSIG